MRGFLSVRINDGHSDRIVTSRVKDLTFRKTAPGGHHSASMRVRVARDAFKDLGPADRLWVYDARTARTVWEGYTENPGVSLGPTGQEYDLSAMGGQILASDQSTTLVYVDRALDQWRQLYVTYPEMSGGPGSTPNVEGDKALVLTMPRGVAVTTGNAVTMIYSFLEDNGLLLGGFSYTVVSGVTDANYETQALVNGSNTPVRIKAASTTAFTPAPSSAGSAFPLGSKHLRLRWQRVAGGATNIATDNVWTSVTDVWVRMLIHTQDGTQIQGPTSYANSYVTASEVAADLIGRGVLGKIDPKSSKIDASAAQIDQLAYPDGAKPSQVFDDLSLYEPDYLWEILESTANGHRFNYRAWPTTPRYEISTKDGYEAPGGEIDLCNRVAVYWTDASGSKQSTIVTADVPELGGDPAAVGFAGRIRDTEAVTLPDGLGSASNAQRVGSQVLAMKNTPPKAARAVVRRPVMDYLTGTTVMPWEIEPGYIVRVRELGEDLRLTEMEYQDNDCAATLTLGTPTQTLDQLLAGLGRAA